MQMTKRTKIQTIKLFVKISIVVAVFATFIVLGFFIKPKTSFENANMKKWLGLSDEQKTDTTNRIITADVDQDLLIQCIDKIADLPDSEEMQIRDAAVLCYNGIKLAPESKEDDKE